MVNLNMIYRVFLLIILSVRRDGTSWCMIYKFLLQNLCYAFSTKGCVDVVRTC